MTQAEDDKDYASPEAIDQSPRKPGQPLGEFSPAARIFMDRATGARISLDDIINERAGPFHALIMGVKEPEKRPENVRAAAFFGPRDRILLFEHGAARYRVLRVSLTIEVYGSKKVEIPRRIVRYSNDDGELASRADYVSDLSSRPIRVSLVWSPVRADDRSTDRAGQKRVSE